MAGISSIKKSVSTLVLSLCCLTIFMLPTYAAPALHLNDDTQVIDVVPYTDHLALSQPFDINQVLSRSVFYKFSPQKKTKLLF